MPPGGGELMPRCRLGLMRDGHAQELAHKLLSHSPHMDTPEIQQFMSLFLKISNGLHLLRSCSQLSYASSHICSPFSSV